LFHDTYYTIQGGSERRKKDETRFSFTTKEERGREREKERERERVVNIYI